MTTRLTPYGLNEYSSTVAKVGKGKTVPTLAARMPSADIMAKVGAKNPIVERLAKRMPSAEIAAKVGISRDPEAGMHRVVRRKSRRH